MDPLDRTDGVALATGTSSWTRDGRQDGRGCDDDSRDDPDELEPVWPANSGAGRTDPRSATTPGRTAVRPSVAEYVTAGDLETLDPQAGRRDQRTYAKKLVSRDDRRDPRLSTRRLAVSKAATEANGLRYTERRLLDLPTDAEIPGGDDRLEFHRRDDGPQAAADE